ncbi:MAG TPA: hypothetical protein VHJ59_04090 [Nitrososphaera sp.]|nr:hypothetical protein [Nitrososphaera sp.]
MSDNLWTAREMNVERQILIRDASKPRAGLYFTSICFVLIVACNELAMQVDVIIFYNKTESSSGYFRCSALTMILQVVKDDIHTTPARS